MGDSMKWLHWDENKSVACFILFLIILKADSLNFQMLKSLSQYLVSFSIYRVTKLANIWHILQCKSTLYSCCPKQMKNAFWVIKHMLERCTRLLSVTINMIYKPSYLQKKMHIFQKLHFRCNVHNKNNLKVFSCPLGLILYKFPSDTLSFDYCELVYGRIQPSDQHGLSYEAVTYITLCTLQALCTLHCKLYSLTR